MQLSHPKQGVTISIAYPCTCSYKYCSDLQCLVSSYKDYCTTKQPHLSSNIICVLERLVIFAVQLFDTRVQNFILNLANSNKTEVLVNN